MRTGHKQAEMQLNSFSQNIYLSAEIGTAPATEGEDAEQLLLLSCLHSEKQECRFLSPITPPQEPLLHPV
jgi:hypothetical protein